MENYNERIQKMISDVQEGNNAIKEKEETEKKLYMKHGLGKEIERKFGDYIISTIENENKGEKIVTGISFKQLYRTIGISNVTKITNNTFLAKGTNIEDGIEISIDYKISREFSSQKVCKRDKEAIDLLGTEKVKEIASALHLVPIGSRIPTDRKTMLDGFLEILCIGYLNEEKSITVIPNYNIKIV